MGFYFRMKTKTPKWYRRILYHFVDLSLVNAFILRNHASGERQVAKLYQFKLEVATSLMHADSLAEPLSRAAILLNTDEVEKSAKGDPVGDANPPDGMRMDGLNHWPNSVATRARCCRLKGCKKRSTVWCTKCKVYLCMKKGLNCFVQYHTVQ
jgi:hypothetical protein